MSTEVEIVRYVLLCLAYSMVDMISFYQNRIHTWCLGRQVAKQGAKWIDCQQKLFEELPVGEPNSGSWSAFDVVSVDIFSSQGLSE